ncbi:MAG TPA: methyltransferase domain-containing protein, partial [Anaeromyxobacter sp.]|nr:methyltransferase domain-containing protein [Anaeromyxobacter sp.]
MAAFYARNGAGDLLARYSFIEPLLEGKRVLEIGAAQATDGATALFLAERGAAAVLSVEPDGADLAAAREAGHHPFVQFRAAEAAELRPGTFDLVLVADGAELARHPGAVVSLRRLLAPGGRLVSALPAEGAGLAELAGEPPAPEPPSYEAFVAALSDHFPLVEVATQSATVGYVVALAADGEEEPDVAMDGTLAGSPETAAYLAICGDEPCGLAGLAVVALPTRPLVDAAAAAGSASAGGAAALERAAEERDEARSAREALAAARDVLLAERDALATEREALLSEKDALLAERDALGAERDEAA